MKLYLTPRDLSFLDKVDYWTDTSFRQKVDASIQSEALYQISAINGDYLAVKEGLQKYVAPLSSAQFDRTQLRLLPIVNKAFLELKASLPNAIDEELKTAIAESQIADWAGFKMLRNRAGTSGSYRLKDLEGKTIAIFKPVNESPHGPLNPHFWIRIRNVIQSWLPINRCIEETKGAEAEVFAFKASQTLGFQDLVPKTAVVSLASESFSDPKTFQKGSFQLFVPDAKDGYEHMEIWGWLSPCMANLFVHKSQNSAQKYIDKASFNEFACLQYLIGNIDGNFGNMLFKKGSNKIVAIDAWFSMPKSPVVGYLDRRGMYAWRSLYWANEQITISKATLQDNKANLIAHIKSLFGNNSDQETEFNLRFDIMIRAIDSNHTWINLIT